MKVMLVRPGERGEVRLINEDGECVGWVKLEWEDPDTVDPRDGRQLRIDLHARGGKVGPIAVTHR